VDLPPLNTAPAPDFKERLAQWATTSPRYPWFKGASADLAEWCTLVEGACEDLLVPRSAWAAAAMGLIAGDLQPVMDERRVKFLEQSGEDFWQWEDFKDDIRRVVLEAEKIIAEPQAGGGLKDSMTQFRQDHPYIVASASAGLVIGGSLMIIPALGLVAMNAIGFVTGGVIGSSIASVLRSVAYGGAASGAWNVIKSIRSKAMATGAPAAETPKEEAPKYAVYTPRRRNTRRI